MQNRRIFHYSVLRLKLLKPSLYLMLVLRILACQRNTGEPRKLTTPLFLLSSLAELSDLSGSLQHTFRGCYTEGRIIKRNVLKQ